MNWLKTAFQRLMALLRPSALEHDMDRELRLHLELLEEQYKQSGIPAEQARLAALRRFGNVGHLKERGRDIRGAGFLDNVLRDLQYAGRNLLGTPVFTAVVVCSLALGIGANTALFSVFDAMFLRALPVRHAPELVVFGWTSGPSPHAFTPARAAYIESHSSGEGDAGQAARKVFSTVFPASVVDRFKAAGGALAAVSAFAPLSTDAAIEGRSLELTAQVVSGNYFETLGVTAAAGRLIGDSDDQSAAAPAVVISHEFWKREFAFDPSAVGKRILLSSVLPATVVGVTPPGFHIGWGVSPDVSIPMAFLPELAADQAQADNWAFGIVGRMRSRNDIQRVQAELQSPFLRGAMQGSALHEIDLPRLLAISGTQGVTRDFVLGSIGLQGSSRRFSLLIIVGAVFSVLLLIVCLNVANLLIARSETRRYEVGVRLAMGAKRSRIIQQFLTESVLLAVVGGGLGTLLAYWGKDLLRVFLQQQSPLILDLRIDLRLLAFSLTISVLTGIVFGLLPAFRATRVEVNAAVKQGGRSLAGSRPGIGRSLLVTQVAMSLVLLIGAGLLLRTLGNLPSTNVGFKMDNLLGFRLSRPILEGDRARYEALIGKIAALPGVTGVTAALDPFVGTDGSFTNADFHPPLSGEDSQVRTGTVRLFWVRPNFFEVMGIPLVRGRGFDSGDSREGRPVAVITESLARQFPSDALGWLFGGDGRPEGEIVGVVKNVGVSEIRTMGMMSEVHGTIFLPELQQFHPGPPSFAGFVDVRAVTSAAKLVPEIRAALRSVDPTFRAFDIATEAQLVERKLAPTKRIAAAWILFGGLALLLTCIGLYGLLSYSVARRTNEIGIRLALGAPRFHVLRMVMGQTFLLICAGIIVGIVASLAISQTIRALIYGVTFYDPVVMAAAVSVMVSVVAIAGYIPARRATRVDPTVALRWE